VRIALLLLECTTVTPFRRCLLPLHYFSRLMELRYQHQVLIAICEGYSARLFGCSDFAKHIDETLGEVNALLGIEVQQFENAISEADDVELVRTPLLLESLQIIKAQASHGF